MSFYGTHPDNQRSRKMAWQARTRGGCTLCRYYWRCGRHLNPCNVCGCWQRPIVRVSPVSLLENGVPWKWSTDA
jgi:hypothetical protein